MLEKIAFAAAHGNSYHVGAKMLDVIGDVSISSRGLNNVAVRVGDELGTLRDARTEAYFAQPLPRQYTQPETPIALAMVSADGGRMQTRLDGSSPGVHKPGWRETKNALFLRMSSQTFVQDPHPDLPRCFADREGMNDLLTGLDVGAESASTTAIPDRARCVLI